VDTTGDVLFKRLNKKLNTHVRARKTHPNKNARSIVGVPSLCFADVPRHYPRMKLFSETFFIIEVYFYFYLVTKTIHMKKAFLLAILATLSIASFAQTRVKSYKTKNGTYVSSHTRKSSSSKSWGSYFFSSKRKSSYHRRRK